MAKNQGESLNSKDLSLVKSLVTKPNLLLPDSNVYIILLRYVQYWEGGLSPFVIV